MHVYDKRMIVNYHLVRLALETSTEDNSTLTFTYPASSLIEDEVLVV